MESNQSSSFVGNIHPGSRSAMTYIIAGANLRLVVPTCSEEERQMKSFEAFVTSCTVRPRTRGEALEWFAGYLFELGYSGGTILGRITFLRDRFPELIDDKKTWFDTARSRMQESQLLRGLKRRRGEEAVQNVKPLYHISTLEMVLNSEVPTRDGKGRKMDSAKMLRWRAFFFILIATGCRPKHVLGIRALILTSRKLLVRWGPRKILVIPPTDYLEYLLEWSCKPPEDVAGFLQTVGVPTISTETNVATACNAWLTSLGTGLTRKEKMNGKSGLSSCCPRVNLSTTLGQQVLNGKLSKELFNILLDHNIESSMTYYRRLSDPETEDEDLIEKEEDEELRD